MSNGVNPIHSSLAIGVLMVTKFDLLDAEGVNLRHRRFPAALKINDSPVSKRVQKQIDHIVSDLFVKATSGDNAYGSVSLDKNRYKGSSISYSDVSNAVRTLEAEGLVVVYKGFSDRKSYKTRIKATDKLVGVVESRISTEALSYLDAVVTHSVDDYLMDRIVVEGVEPAIGSRLDRSIRVLKKNLRLINENNLKHNIRIPRESTADITRLVMHRVFNSEDLSDGGRFYGGFWITMPKHERLGIEINRKPIVELDYSGMHIALLYKLEGISCPVGDLYDAGFKYPRSAVKDALLKMINAKDAIACLRAISAEYALSWEQKKDLVNRIAERHKAISKYFYSGFGIRLQCLDAEIAENIMLSFIERTGGFAAILPVHESFIVSRSWEEDLRAVMEECFMEAGIKHHKQKRKELNPLELERSLKDGSQFVSTDLKHLMTELQANTNPKYSLDNL